MTHTLVIAECGSSWDCDTEKAFRLIDAAKECGADVAKFQWTSNAKAMAERRLGSNAAQATQMYKRYLEYSPDVLTRLKAHCDSVSIEFACTTFLPEDIDVIDPLVKRFKISAFESDYTEHVTAHLGRYKPVYISVNPGKNGAALFDAKLNSSTEIKILHCISEYPCPLEKLKLTHIGDFGSTFDESRRLRGMRQILDGFSDHSTSTLTGALSVAAGGSIVEKHIRLHDTDSSNPDYGHSLVADCNPLINGDVMKSSFGTFPSDFGIYVRNIREAERAL